MSAVVRRADARPSELVVRVRSAQGRVERSPEAWRPRPFPDDSWDEFYYRNGIYR